MWMIVLTYAALFIGIAAGTLLLPGLIIGLNHAFKHVYGVSNDVLCGYTPRRVMGLIPASILGLGMCSVVGGLFGVEFAYWGDSADPNPVLLLMKLSAVFGLLNVVVVNGWLWLLVSRKEEPSTKQLRRIYRIASYVAGALTGFIFGKQWGLVGGIVLGFIVGKSVGVLVYGYAMLAFPIAVRIIMPIIILIRFATIICNRCLRWTEVLKARYEHGVRYCEFCDQPVENTKDPGRVVLIFGNLQIQRQGRVFLLANPDFEHKEHRIDLSDVYIDTPTCDRRLFERFITYVLNFPPRDGLAAIQVFYRGALDELGTNLANTLRNNFPHIAEFHA